MISVVIIQFNGGIVTRDAVASFYRSNRGDYEIILVDNGSTKEEIQHIRNLGCTIIENKVNVGFGRACNQGAAAARGDYLFFLNNDTLTEQDMIHPIESYFASNAKCGALGIRLRNIDRTVQRSTGQFPSILYEWRAKHGNTKFDPGKSGPVDWVTGAALIIPKINFMRIGGFDEEFFMYFEDAELCKRVWNSGFEVHFAPIDGIVHLGAIGKADNKPPHIQLEYRKSQLRYYAKHTSIFQQLVLRVYLTLKFGLRVVLGSPQQKVVARMILPIIFS